jgi:mannose-6-phosphate isomerase-like protein (cupin superfamily)
MEYVKHAADAPDGRLFEVEHFTQRLRILDGHERPSDDDEVLYILEGQSRIIVDASEFLVGPGTAVFFARGASWVASGNARAVSVLVHEPERAGATHGVVDLGAAELGTATAGRSFLLGATPDCGCNSATQFIGLIPPGRAPDHFHRYDEVIYVLEGEGLLEIGGEQAPLGPGSCVHLPRTVVHALANTGASELRVLGVFRPAGSPAEAYYPDGTPAAVPTGED